MNMQYRRYGVAGLVLMMSLGGATVQAAAVPGASPAVCADSRSLSLATLPLPHRAVAMSPDQLQAMNGAHGGFVWNDEDNNDLYWRPQGITDLGKIGDRHLLAVSWYGLPSKNRAKDNSRLGVRIAFADVTDMAAVSYQHVLLLDERGKPFSNMHAGGLVYKDGRLHVPDTREATERGWLMHVFSVHDIQAADAEKYPGFAVVLKRESYYHVPVKPSFISYDGERDRMLVGVFKATDDDADPDNRLAWVRPGESGCAITACGPFWGKMQGAVSATEAASGRQVVWATSSYGNAKPGYLHAAYVDPAACATAPPALQQYRKRRYPPGLEALHMTLPSAGQDIWMLTEFGPDDRGNNRFVFVTRKDRLMPEAD